MSAPLLVLGIALASLSLVALSRACRFAGAGQERRALVESGRFLLAVLAALTCFAIAMGRPA